MRSFAGFIWFMTVFLSIYLAMNAYVLFRIAGLLGAKRNLWLYGLLAVGTFSFLFATMLEHRFGHPLTRILYVAAAVWMGVVVIGCMVLAVHEVARLALPLKPRTAGWVVIAIILLISGYAVINGQRLRVKTVMLAGPVDLTAVQLTDIHLGSIGPEALAEIVEKTNELEPDVVFITGDLADNFTERTRRGVALLKKLERPAFFVTGNHEWYVRYERILPLIEAAGVRVLRNEVQDFAGMQIIGVDDSYREGHLEEVLEGMDIDPEKFAILLYHRPRNPEAAQRKGVDLMLAGHTHNGQIFPFNYVVRMNQGPYIKGLHRLGDMWLNVSVGTGNWGPPMRLGSRREIMLICLKQEAVPEQSGRRP